MDRKISQIITIISKITADIWPLHNLIKTILYKKLKIIIDKHAKINK